MGKIKLRFNTWKWVTSVYQNTFVVSFAFCLFLLRSRDAMLDSTFDFSDNLGKFCHYFKIKILVWQCQLLIKYTDVSCAISSLNYSHMCIQYEKMCGTRSFSLFAHEIQSGFALNFLLLLKERDAHQDVVWKGNWGVCELSRWIKQELKPLISTSSFQQHAPRKIIFNDSKQNLWLSGNSPLKIG